MQCLIFCILHWYIFFFFSVVPKLKNTRVRYTYCTEKSYFWQSWSLHVCLRWSYKFTRWMGVATGWDFRFALSDNTIVKMMARRGDHSLTWYSNHGRCQVFPYIHKVLTLLQAQKREGMRKKYELDENNIKPETIGTEGERQHQVSMTSVFKACLFRRTWKLEWAGLWSR
jgi:hypothetical protein